MSNGYPEQVRTYLPHPWQLFKAAWGFYQHHSKLIAQIAGWPALVGLVYLMFGPFILVDQKHHGLAALTASWAYVATYWWSVFGRLLFLLVPAALVTLLIRLGGWPIGLIFFWFLFWPVGLIYLFQIYAWLKRLKPDVEVAIANGPKKQD